MTSCEIHVPISPTPSFFTRVQYLAAAVREFGGPLADSRIIVTVGADQQEEVEGRLPWSRHGLEWRWVPQDVFARYGIYATATQRYTYEFDSPFVLFLDCDTLFTSPPQFLRSAVVERGGIAGVIGLGTPFRQKGDRPFRKWRSLFEAAGLPRPRFEARHPGWGVQGFAPGKLFTPPYFNQGVLFSDRATMNAIGRRIYAELDHVNRFESTWFRLQLGLTLAIVRTGSSWYPLPLRFNFPNNPGMWRAHPLEAHRMQIVHYYSQHELDRELDFETPDAVDGLLGRRLTSPADRILQDRLRDLRPSVLALA